MTRTVALPVLAAVCWTGAQAQTAIRLKKNTVEGLRGGLVERVKSRNPGREHRIVSGTGGMAELLASGGAIVGYVPDHAVMAVVPAEYPEGRRMEGDEKWSAANAALEGRGLYVVEFHADVDLADARAIVVEEGLLPRGNPDLLPNHILIEASDEEARRLTAWDEVAYVFPGSGELGRGEPVRACAGALTAAGPVGNYTAFVGDGWDGPGKGAARIRYRVQNLSEALPATAATAEIVKALSEWSRHVQVDFEAGGAAGDPRLINILFAHGRHEDPFAFDGPGRVLAHTFYPSPPNPEPIAGDLHFDSDEPWKIGADPDLFSVALHELGHALGIGHSDLPGSVMYAYYRKASALTASDIEAARTLYSSRTAATSPPSAPNPAPAPAPAPPANPTPPPAEPPAAPTADRTPPALAVISPSTSSVLTSSASITVRGTAADNSALRQVVWSTNTGQIGGARGTDTWSAEIPLLKGNNHIIIRAFDAAGNSSWRSVVVRRR